MKSALPAAIVGAFAIFLLFREWDSGRRSLACDAVVLNSTTTGRSGATLGEVSYRLNGQPVVASFRSWFCHLHPRQVVPILYIPGDPTNVELAWFWQRHFGSTIALTAFAVFAAVEATKHFSARREPALSLLRHD